MSFFEAPGRPRREDETSRAAGGWKCRQGIQQQVQGCADHKHRARCETKPRRKLSQIDMGFSCVADIRELGHLQLNASCGYSYGSGELGGNFAYACWHLDHDGTHFMETSSRLAVLLHADIVGSTVLVQQDERIAHARMQSAFHAFAETISSYGGTTHELRGDALVAEFPRPSDAVIASLAFQAHNAVINEAIDDSIRPVVRVGIALGEVVIADRTVTGAGIVLAQRIEQHAEPGGVCISAAIREALPARLPVQLESLGAQALKGFDEPVQAYLVALGPDVEIPAPEPTVPSLQTGRPSKPWRLIASVVSVVVVLLVAGVSIGVQYWPSSTPVVAQMPTPATSRPLPKIPSVAVLPFKSIGEGETYFAQGLTSDITADLSRFSGLFVTSARSVFGYAGKAVDIAKVAADLGVRYVVTGSAQHTGGKVRVNIDLIEGATGKRQWSDRFDRSAEDLFAVQDAITREVVAALAVRVDDVETKRSLRKSGIDLAAYDYVLRGRALDQQETRDANLESQRMYQLAIERDPGLAQAYSGLGFAVLGAMAAGWSNDPGAALQRSHDLAEASLDMAPQPEGHALLGMTYMLMRHFDLAQVELGRAIELNPNDAASYAALGSVYLWSSKLEPASVAFAKAIRLNPNASGDAHAGLGLTRFLLGNAESAIGLLERAARFKPEDAFIRAVSAAVLLELNRDEAARAAAQATRKLHPFFSASPYKGAFADPKHGQRLSDALARAGFK